MMAVVVIYGSVLIEIDLGDVMIFCLGYDEVILQEK